ncbi:uncharacterized protein LOC134467236 [Engraulis encrasicolus]|uniref:uncharacterized protein LOC134467236 n=1 Tax=Engraulis encrasicolus TaxID=184585 RepID=UPI002FD0281A
MSTTAKLRVIFDDLTVRKLILPSGIPSTLQDLKLVIQSTFSTPDGFSLMYQDVEFGGQFFTLTSIEDVQDRGTLKVVKVEPVIVDLCAVEESDGVSSTSLASQDTILLSSSSDESPLSQPWPRNVEIGETKEAMEEERVVLLTEVKKNNNEEIIREKMEKTFSYRRLEVVNQMPSVPDVMARWPALFYESQVKEEFKRITTIHLDQTFLTKMDLYTPKLLTIFKTKGGTAGTKINSVLESLSQKQIYSHDAVIRCLIHFLGESAEELIKDYQQDVSKDAIEQDIKDHEIKILVLGSAAEGVPPTDVIIVIDGTEVLGGCKTLTNACILLMGFVYSLDLRYPPKLQYTFEVFQKLFLELDDFKFSPKVDSLWRKLVL